MAGHIMTLSGWGQPHDALEDVAPGAVHLEYAHHPTVRDALEAIAAQGRQYDAIIGWSLGGQLAARAIASGMLKPKRLVLIAAPFQFVATPESRIGMKRDLYDKFRGNYARHPGRTLHKAWELIHKDDARADHVRAKLEQYDKEQVLEKDWLRWLDLLDGFTFDGLPLQDFPPTLLIHGGRDAVVDHAQSRRFMQALPQARLLSFEEAGHAPHWHATNEVREQIMEHAHV